MDHCVLAEKSFTNNGRTIKVHSKLKNVKNKIKINVTIWKIYVHILAVTCVLI